MKKEEKTDYSLSIAAIKMNANLKSKGKLIKPKRKRLIENYAGVAAGEADLALEQSGLTNNEAKRNLWNRVYHTGVDKMLKDDGLRV